MADIEIDTKPHLRSIDVRDQETGICVGWFELPDVPAIGDTLEIGGIRGEGLHRKLVVTSYRVVNRVWDLTDPKPANNTIELRVTPESER